MRAQFVVSGPDASSKQPRPVNIASFDYDQRKEMIDALIEDDEEAAYEAFINGLQTDFGGSVDVPGGRLDIGVTNVEIDWDGGR